MYSAEMIERDSHREVVKDEMNDRYLWFRNVFQ